MFVFKVHETEGKKILACCDSEIRGKLIQEFPKIEAGDFYGSEEIGEEVVESWEQYDSINLLGNNIVSLFIREGIIKEDDVITIGGVMHAIIIKI